MLEREDQLAPDVVRQHLARSVGFVAEAEHIDPVVDDVLQYLPVQIVLAVDVVVQLLLGQAGAFGDRLGRCT